MKKYIFFFTIIIGSFTFFSACEDDDDTVKTAELLLAADGLPSLDDFHVYEGWIMVNNTAASIGRFTVSESGELSQTSFTVDADELNNASAFVISVEPEPDNDAAPTDVHILAGSFIGNSATLSIGHESAIGTGFSSVAGKYILATPTNDENTDELSGIWWLVPGEPNTPSLQLPELNDGWIYEGWVVINEVPVSTGKFSETNMADMSARHSATLPAPEFPGEDFLRNAPAGLTFPTNLSGERAVISVEPDPDNSEAPFAIKPLTGDIPVDAKDHTLYDMTDNTGSINISGNVTR